MLGEAIPETYSQFLRDPANRDSEIVHRFIQLVTQTSKMGQFADCRWTKEFPFTPDAPLKVVTPEELLASQENHDLEQEEKALAELSEYIAINFEEPASRGIITLCNNGCNAYTILILRGIAKGQVWSYEITFEHAEVVPRRHPLTNEPLSFADWLLLQQTPYQLSVLPRKKVQLLTYPKLSTEGRTCMKALLAARTLQGLSIQEIDGLKRVKDIPRQARFLDPYSNTWELVADAQVYYWADGCK